MTCPTNPEHGRVYDLSLDRWYCPHSDHDKGTRSKCFFSEEEVLAGHVKQGVAVAPRKRGRRK